MKRTPLRRVSKKRAKQNREYTCVRKAYLQEHQYCEVCQKEHLLYMRAFMVNEEYDGPIKSDAEPIKKAKEVHHILKRYGDRLNDSNWFLAVCNRCHTWIHDNPSIARDIYDPKNPKRLYLQDHLKTPISIKA